MFTSSGVLASETVEIEKKKHHRQDTIIVQVVCSASG